MGQLRGNYFLPLCDSCSEQSTHLAKGTYYKNKVRISRISIQFAFRGLGVLLHMFNKYLRMKMVKIRARRGRCHNDEGRVPIDPNFQVILLLKPGNPQTMNNSIRLLNPHYCVGVFAAVQGKLYTTNSGNGNRGMSRGELMRSSYRLRRRKLPSKNTTSPKTTATTNP